MNRIARPSGKRTALLLAAAALLVYTAPVASQGGRRSADVDEPAAVEGEVLVKFRTRPNAMERAILDSQVDADRHEEVGSIGVHRLHSRSLRAAALVNFFRMHPNVEYVEP